MGCRGARLEAQTQGRAPRKAPAREPLVIVDLGVGVAGSDQRDLKVNRRADGRDKAAGKLERSQTHREWLHAGIIPARVVAVGAGTLDEACESSTTPDCRSAAVLASSDRSGIIGRPWPRRVDGHRLVRSVMFSDE